MRGSSTLDYDAVLASLADAAVTPGDPAYRRLTSTVFRGGVPAIVLLPRTVEQVVDAVDFAGRHLHLPLGIRSGGHGLSGRSTNDGGIVIDLRHLNGIHVLDPAAQHVRIGPGVRSRDVAAALQPHGWALWSGDSGAVGVGGLATSGGIGLLARPHGLASEWLVAAHVVLADGSTEPTMEGPLDGVWSRTSPASTRRSHMSLNTPLEPAAVGRTGTGGPIGRWLTKRVMNRVRRNGEAMGMGLNALVLTTIRCTSGRERNAVASMGGPDPT